MFEGLLHMRELLAGAVARTEGRDEDARRELAALEELLTRLRRHSTTDVVFEEAWERYLARRV